MIRLGEQAKLQTQVRPPELGPSELESLRAQKLVQLAAFTCFMAAESACKKGQRVLLFLFLFIICSARLIDEFG